MGRRTTTAARQDDHSKFGRYASDQARILDKNGAADGATRGDPINEIGGGDPINEIGDGRKRWRRQENP